MRNIQVGSTQFVVVDSLTLGKHKTHITIKMDFVARNKILLSCTFYNEQQKAQQPSFITDKWIETALEKTGYLELVDDIKLCNETWLEPTVEVTLKMS